MDFQGITHVFRNPAGSLSLAGSVPIAASYCRRDGKPMTEKDVAKIGRCGVGMFRDTYKGLWFDTIPQAVQAITAAGGSFCALPDCACRIER